MFKSNTAVFARSKLIVGHYKAKGSVKFNIFFTSHHAGNMVAEEIYNILRLVFIRFSLFSSIFNLIAMTIDRYLSIFHPVKQRNRSRYFVRLVICAVWVFSFVAVVLVYCITRWVVAEESTMSINLVFPISSYPATMVFVYCYIAIYMWIRQRNRNDIKNEVKLLFVLIRIFFTTNFAGDDSFNPKM